MLEIKDLCVSYGAIDAVKGISLKVDDGEIVSLIGANGAGKTTTLHTITGLVPAKSGSITYDVMTCLRRMRTRSSPWAWPTCRKAAMCSPA